MKRQIKALRTSEACDALGIDLITLYRRIQRGDQAASKEGNRWRIFVWDYLTPEGQSVYPAIPREEAVRLFVPDFVTVGNCAEDLRLLRAIWKGRSGWVSVPARHGE